ncbi:MAG: hypothetical protein EP322_01410 [Bacteroidetes bacterium]|nr:MAG: hypothetical protein EP322_01410 [Bacteroidota bacterium]
MPLIRFNNIIFLLFGVLLAACNSTRNVPANKYLLEKNDVAIVGDKLSREDIDGIIRQQPNYKRFGVKWRLMAYNVIDSVKVADKRQRKNIQLREKNKKRLIREDRINSRRVERARKKGNKLYTHKTVHLKDTADPQMFIREWYKYKIGRPPVIFDSTQFLKSIEQLNAYLKKKGYYYGDVNGIVEFSGEKKCVANYLISTGERYMIDSVYLICPNKEVAQHYQLFIDSKQDKPLIGKPFDADLLDDHRSDISKFMRDSSFYGFSPKSVRYIVDTNYTNMKVKLGVEIGDRVVTYLEYKDSVSFIPYKKYMIENVYFHMPDTVHLEGDYFTKVSERRLPDYDKEFLHTFDTLAYVNVRDAKLGEVNPDMIFLYNGKLYLKPRVFEIYSYVYGGEKYYEKNMEATYNRLRGLDMFNEIKTKITEDKEHGSIEVHHYMMRGKRQSFSFEPRATNSNGFLGVSANVQFVNKNLFGGAEHLKIGISGGLESQPPVLQEQNGEVIQTSERSLNTIEISPTIQLEVPGFFPFRSTKLARKRRPQTIIGTAYNYQDRQEFTRGTFQLSYDWEFIVRRTHRFQVGFPLVSVIKFISIDKTDEFDTKLKDLNDLFIFDAYSNQFVWQDWRFKYEYNISEKLNRRHKFQMFYSTIVDPAGNVLSMFRDFQDTLQNGKYGINGVAYSQFMRVDNEFVFSQPFSKERSMNFRVMLGAGVPYGNSENSLPYDYSFFAGGANDIRGWPARTMGPGVYKYYLDTNRTITQLGNFKLGGSAEWRFPINSFFKAAFFMDAGNIWTFSEDPNRLGGNITSDWYKQLMVSSGVGIRIDFEYFIFRLDIAVPVRNPSLPVGTQWVWNDHTDYYQYVKDELGYIPVSTPNPFKIRYHFGIGYPF